MGGRGVIFPRSHRAMLLHKWATVDDGAAMISAVALPIGGGFTSV
jgi:hypothetical protein